MEVTSGYQYLVVETAHDDIADYRWDYVTYPGGGYNESKLVWVYENAVSEPIYVNNGFEELANSEINSLPLTVAGYALDAMYPLSRSRKWRRGLRSNHLKSNSIMLLRAVGMI